MIVLLPEEVDGLKDVERRLTADTLQRAIKSLSIHDVNLLFPKFKIEHTLPAKTLLVQVFLTSVDYSPLYFFYITHQGPR